MSFKLLSDLKSQLEALEKASHGKIEVWADLPAHENDLQNQLSGKPVPLRFGPADSDSLDDKDWEQIEIPNLAFNAPFRLRLFPEDCERLFRSDQIEVINFIPPPEISELKGLDIQGKEKEGLQWMVYPLYQERGVMGHSVRISRNRIYLRSEKENLDETEPKINYRKPHLGYAHDALEKGLTRSKAWREFKSKAVSTKGVQPIEVPHYGTIYLKLSHDPSNMLFKTTPFEGPRDEAEAITKGAFDSAWSRIIKQKRS